MAEFICKCGCGQVIDNPRMRGGKVIQEFIDNIHRSRYHNHRLVKIDKIPDLITKAFERAKYEL